MKKTTTYLLCCLAYCSHAQPRLITYVNKVALVVQSDVYVDTLLNDTLMDVLSGRIRIALAPRKMQTETDQYLIAGDAMPQVPHEKIVYRIGGEGVAREWRSVPSTQTIPPQFPYGRLLADTFLQPGENIWLEFRRTGSKEIWQRCVFARVDLSADIQQYRENKHSSHLDDSIQSRVLRRNAKRLEGFLPAPARELSASAGAQLEILLKPHALSKDSSLEYRIRFPGHTTSDWKTTGHLLTLDSLPSNDSVVLELRYEGMPRIHPYTLKIDAYWYERLWAKTLFLFTGIAGFVVLPWEVYRRRKRWRREKRDRDVILLKNAQNQLNPHFVFNALNSIDALVHAGENEKATRYLADFSDMMRNTLRNNDLVFTNLSEDLAILEKYIRIEQLRFDFRYEIRVMEQLNTEAIEFPPMLLQPTVENAVKHGVSGMHERGLISVDVTQSGNDLVISIKDNGGRKGKPSQGTGNGIAFTRERIAILENIYSYTIRYELGFGEEGTVAIFYFKNWL